MGLLDWFGDAGSAIYDGGGDVWNAVRGDPRSVKAAYDQAMGQANQYGQQQKDFLMGQQAKTMQLYAPLQQMFQGAYGTQGIAGPQVPSAPGGAGPLQQMFGGRR